VTRALGVARVVFGLDTPLPVAADRAAALGWDHIDITVGTLDSAEEASLALPVGDRYSGEVALPGCTVRTPRRDVAWEDAVAFLRSTPAIRCEPSPFSILHSVAAIREMCRAVPGLRITLDTGHVAAWGEDPVEVLDLAGHVQLRQARRGVPQVHIDDRGDVDFAAVMGRLDGLRYAGLVSVEYVDLPDLGLALDDPIGWAVDLTRRVREL
jgi:sugar phosphate isomerase/epimerase